MLLSNFIYKILNLLLSSFLLYNDILRYPNEWSQHILIKKEIKKAKVLQVTLTILVVKLITQPKWKIFTFINQWDVKCMYVHIDDLYIGNINLLSNTNEYI